MSTVIPKRGCIYSVNLDPSIGSEQAGTRPCVVIQNDIGNANSPTSLVIPLSSKLPKRKYPFQVLLVPSETGLDKVSVAKCDQIQVISIKHRLQEQLGRLSDDAMHRLEKAVLFELGIDATLDSSENVVSSIN